ncbi:MAG: tetratricopeptide repeat protein [Cyclonatronaceae bacterium]
MKIFLAVQRTGRIIFTLIFVLCITFTPLSAQTGAGEYSLGNELLRQGNFEEAYEIFERMMAENPRSYAIFERATTALINLKRYDEAIRITRERLQRRGDDINTRVKLGEILDIANNRQEALETWHEVLERNSQNIQAYRRVAETMNQRRLFREAIKVYERARNEFSDTNLFTFEIANNYLAVADFEPAVEELLDIIGQDNRRVSLVQRQLLNYDERALYDTAILLTEERLGRHTSGSEIDLALRDFLVWLTMERGLYRRALAAARNLEHHSSNQYHAMFRTGRELRNRSEFELAEQAFQYYLDLETHPLQARSHEELSRTYQRWAGHLVDRNLDFDGTADSLYRKAFFTIEQLTDNYPRYDRMMEVLVIQSELALDHLKEPDRAATYHQKMERIARDDSDKALMHLVDGRLKLFEGAFSMARVSFNRSNRLAESGETADMSRFFLGLGDFYNSDFTYARLQLRALERQQHSWYANNALNLRFIIQEGYDEDGNNQDIRRYANALYLFDTGRYLESVRLLADVTDEPASGPLQGESMLLLTRALRKLHPGLAFQVVDRHVHRSSVRNNAGERLLWERARLGEVMYLMQQGEAPDEDSGSNYRSVLPAHLVELHEGLTGPEGYRAPLINADSVIVFYEDLLMHYPGGFYSHIVRERIRELEQEQREL